MIYYLDMEKKNKTQIKKRKIWFLDISYIPLIIAALVTMGMVFLVYRQTQDILKERLRLRLTSIVATGVLGIDGNELEQIIEMEKISPQQTLKSRELADVIDHMQRVRDENQNIQYIYIWNKTDDPNFVRFAADAEMIDPIDLDENGLIEDIEIPPEPGELYESTDIEHLQEGFENPVAQKEFIIDKWGVFMSAFAPIRNSNGETVAVLGIDVEVEDFTSLITATLIPFSVLAIILLLMLSVQTVALVRIWGNRVEVMKELDRQKDDLLSIVSHQLATPVSSAKWYMEMLLDGDVGKLTSDQKEHITTIQSVMTNLSDLVSMILDVSRIQLGKMKVDRAELDINTFFDDILDVIKPKAQERSIELNIEVPNNIPSAMLDKRLMRMTLENLLSNAVKYSDEKHGKVDFHVDVKGNKLMYYVRDNGCGIPKKDQEKIFGKLFRASNVQSVDGNGFGLYAAKGAVQTQGGSIRFESEEGKGATFFVELPILPDKS
jgi:signal transduction histidine kinase